jgi:hypothetical protein
MEIRWFTRGIITKKINFAFGLAAGGEFFMQRLFDDAIMVHGGR